MNAFDKWFTGQFGSLPNPQKRIEIEISINVAKSNAAFMEQEAHDLKRVELIYEGAKKAYYNK